MAHPNAAGGVNTATRGTHQWLALAIGVVYLLIGLLGFLVTGFDGFVEHDHSRTLLGFAINPLHNIVHILIGVLGLSMWKRSDTARTFGWILAVVYGATFLFGLVFVNNETVNILNINGADNILHLFSTLAGLAIALWPRSKDPRLAR